MLSTIFAGYRCQFTTVLTVTLLMVLDSSVQGQVVEDNTTNTKVQAKQNISVITGGIQSGTNLFHSFKEFSLLTDEVANFDHSLEIENIFSRITGGTASEIDGLIQTQGNASLFLLNPAGVVFGANAQLDLGGSLIVSTGDRLTFADGTEFSAVSPRVETLLTISAPIGLQYGSQSSTGGTIEILPNTNRNPTSNGLNINPGNTLALLGGDVSITRNSLNTIDANLAIASVKSGTIVLQPDPNGWQFTYDQGSEFGNINLSDRALINSRGQVNLQGQTINFNSGSGILDFNQLSKIKSSINLNASENINLDQGLLVTQVGLRSDSADEAIADAGGDIIITAPQVSISNGAIISAGTLKAGAGGSITINAADQVKLFSEKDHNPSLISTSTSGTGQGGSVKINTGQLVMEDGSQIQALAGSGSGGKITINASKSVDLSGTGILRSRSVGYAQSRDQDGSTSETKLASGFAASSGFAGLPIAQQPGGESGSLRINTPRLTIDQGAQISVSNYGLANAGDIKITTSTLNLDHDGQIIAHTASGEGGSINILANQSVMLDHGGKISTTAAQDGNGGNIMLKTENLALLNFNQISADASQGSGGDVSIDTQGFFIDPSSRITASSEVAQKQGNVAISTLDLNSRLATDYIEQSPLEGENQISSSCGVGIDLNSNHIHDIGRGGIPHNPLQENAYVEILNDWGIDETHILSSTKFNRDTIVLEAQPLVEFNSWAINSQGVVELIGNTTQNISLALCQANQS
ncbi:MAG: filamentous hemagglutinin N-terminal domain-containing protein [Waterburya sp.]